MYSVLFLASSLYKNDLKMKKINRFALLFFCCICAGARFAEAPFSNTQGRAQRPTSRCAAFLGDKTIVNDDASAGKCAPASGASGIVYQSKDAGKTWEDIGAGLPNDLQVEYVELKDGHVFLGSENGGLYKSGVDVFDWQKVGGMPVFPNEKITGIFPTSDGVFVSVFRGGFFQNPGVGDVWVSKHNALKDKAVRAVLKTKKALLTGVDGGIYRSEDGGKPWKQVFAEGQVTGLAESNGVLIGGAYRGVLRSTDGGESWQWVLEDGGAHKIAVIDGRFAVVDLAGGLRISPDGGKTWRRMDYGLPPNKPVYDLVKADGFLFCSNDEGIFRSPDEGLHWELVRATPNETFLDLTFSNGVIYGGTVRR
jgi:photosystem II stability/assembly factor-like uncharacterized protein